METARRRKYQVNIDPDIYLNCYQHLHQDKDIDIDLIWGSRDSGKSRDTAMRLVERCLTAPYFRHILVRKVYATIKDSQFQLIKDIVEEWGIQELFDFNTSPMEIRCVNGNKFIARGFDKAAKVKSLQNPSGAWIEEANELTESDWNVLITTLRNNEVRIKVDLTFNPECDGDYVDFWIFKEFLAPFYNEGIMNFTHTRVIDMGDDQEPHKITYRSTHTTYQDNPYCTPQRRAVYEGLRTTDPYYYQVYAKGKWGRKANLSPFILTFNRARHVVPKIERDITKPIWLSFDFNRDPLCVSIYQIPGPKAMRWLEVIKQPNTTIYQVCDLIKAKYPRALFFVGGDFSGTSRSALIKDTDTDNYYKVIKKELGLGEGNMKYEPNPLLVNNRVVCNFALEQIDITFDERKCQPLFFDFENAEVLADGSLNKADRENPKHQLDALDTWRYAINLHHKNLNPLKNR